jgi:dUTP pyrophosphatase
MATTATATGTIKFKRLTTDAVVPTVSTRGSAGMDIASRVQIVVPAKEWVTIPTGIAMEIPGDCYARIAPRSGLAFHYGLMINAGVVDSDYRGEVKVIMYNPGTTAYHIAAGDKIAQLIFERIYAPSDLFVVVSDPNMNPDPDQEPVTESSALSSSERGDQGFGSTERRAPVRISGDA